jgi:hypothetical protein
MEEPFRSPRYDRTARPGSPQGSRGRFFAGWMPGGNAGTFRGCAEPSADAAGGGGATGGGAGACGGALTVGGGAAVTTTGGGRGGGVADASGGVTAHPIPPTTKRANPSAGSQNGVSGSSAAGEAVEAASE